MITQNEIQRVIHTIHRESIMTGEEKDRMFAQFIIDVKESLEDEDLDAGDTIAQISDFTRRYIN